MEHPNVSAFSPAFSGFAASASGGVPNVLTERPHTRVPSADTVLRGVEELTTENISYTAEKTGNVYDFNTAEKLNQLLIKLLLATGQLTEGGAYDVDFDHQFLEADKYD
ncbi:MAG: hypothetical protein IJR24_05400, partial [Alloprevotella sp.]|nr:hypothetical protein [Alloprevotella sp.]